MYFVSSFRILTLIRGHLFFQQKEIMIHDPHWPSLALCALVLLFSHVSCFVETTLTHDPLDLSTASQHYATCTSVTVLIVGDLLVGAPDAGGIGWAHC